jgi:tetratricopeptide (TPR) repeat protein
VIDQIDRWLSHARRMSDQGQHQAAVEALRQALAADPDHAVAHAMLALELVALRRIYAAEIEARAALLSDSEESMGFAAMGAVKLAQRKLADAETNFLASLELSPDDADTYRMLAEVERLRGRPEAARASLERGLEIDPEDPDLLVALGELAMQQGDLDEAGRLCERAQAIAPEHLDGHVLAGHLALRDGELSEATEHARFALSIDPTDISALELLCSIKARRSWLLGAWWRLNVFLSTGSERRQIGLLVISFALFQALIAVLATTGAERIADLLDWAWLGLCTYTWAAPAQFKRLLEAELEQVVLDDDF